MSTAISDFMVHIDEHLDTQQSRQLENLIRSNNCVISAAIPHHTPHLMMVVYDSECTHARDILDNVREAGMHASLL
jgi:hypothetical protein